MNTAAEEAAFLLAAVRQAVARSSIRAVSRQTGISHGGVSNLVAAKASRLNGATVRKLREWYLREWAGGHDSLTPEVAMYLIEQVLAAIQPGARKAAALELVHAVERIYDSHGAPRPAWLGSVGKEYRGESE